MGEVYRARSQLVWVDRSGNVLPIAELPGQLGGTDWDWSTFSLSPDRHRAVLGLRQGSAENPIGPNCRISGSFATDAFANRRAIRAV